jgi:Amt family ammonium transporter
MTLSDKVRRLGARLRLPEWRRYGALLLTGKLTGIAVLLLGILFFNPSLLGFGALAQTADTLKASDIVNPFNTVWTLIAAFLVFGMQVGFTMLEAGFCRSRETVNVLMECIVDTCLCGLLFFAFGFAFMFSHGNGFIGMNWFFLQGAPATYEASGVAFLAFWLFQFAFADTCSTITSGAMIGRTGLCWRPAVQLCGVRLHLSDHRPLGMGTGWLPRNDGKRRKFPSFTRHELP